MSWLQRASQFLSLHCHDWSGDSRDGKAGLVHQFTVFPRQLYHLFSFSQPTPCAKKGAFHPLLMGRRTKHRPLLPFHVRGCARAGEAGRKRRGDVGITVSLQDALGAHCSLATRHSPSRNIHYSTWAPGPTAAAKVQLPSRWLCCYHSAGGWSYAMNSTPRLQVGENSWHRT